MYKTDENGNELTGAVFTLIKDSQQVDGSPTDPAVSSTTFNLEYGIYCLTETTAPNGYFILSNKIYFKVDDNGIKRNYLRITFDSFTQNATNDFYRDHVVEVRIVCHFDTWNLLDFDQRPYRLAGEIDAMLANQRLSGIGLLTFLGADQDVYNIEYGGLTLRYLAIRGEEDRKNPLQ